MSEVKKYRADWRHVVETEFDDAQFVGIVDFDAQRLRADTAEDERDALRYKAKFYDEVWADATGRGYANVTMALCALSTAEQRIAEMIEFIRDAADSAQSAGMLKAFINQLDAALNPNPEAESHE